ncbi:DUF3164 family protein [Flavobacterium sp. N2820]|uniref:DUF3164 family protein n=1 Tax=Flavobacterium sp. N2820 TaxID=2986834 RepID=UPI0022258977|nr:DUF3164 family protein [Flavobacterium sp. N2820]
MNLINNIEVIEPQILTEMSTETLEKPIDVSQLTEQELLDALAKKKNHKNEQREAYKALVAETVPKAIFRLCHASEILSVAKKETFEFFENILSLKNEVYELKEKQRSHTFSTDTSQITIGYRVNDGWDDTAHAGVEKVKNFITSLAKDTDTAALVEMVFDLLKKDANGNLKSNRVLELQKLTQKFNNPEFSDGVEIISKAFKPVRSSWYIEACLIEEGKKTPIPLNISSVDFAEGYKFDFFSKEDKEDGSSN